MFLLIIIGFLAGVATVLSPCILPILPIMLSGAVGGKTRPYGILAGFVLSFALFTVFATAIVQSLGISIDILRYVAAVILVFLGIVMLFPKIQYKFFKTPNISAGEKGGFWGGFATGATLGLVWAPCAGPILGAVITLAVTTQAGLASFLIVLSYALGTGIIMLIIILASRTLLEKIKGLYNHLEKIHKIFGILIIIAALGIATGYDRKLQGYIVDKTPESWTNFLQSIEENNAVMDALEDLDDDNDGKSLQEEMEDFIGDEEGRKTTGELINKAVDMSKFSNFKTNTDKTSIDLNDLLSGGPSKDGIPALANPKFVDVDKSDIDDEVLGVLVSSENQTRFYPYNILVWHEIVNDSIGDYNFAVTFCPLCGSAIVFDRNVDGELLEFGVSGFLYESNLVMYDKQTESLWSQAGLESLVGDYLGTELKVLDMKLIPMSEVREKYPQADILSIDTGYDRDYDFYPYSGYEDTEDVYFPVSISDKRFPPKEVMYVVPYKGKSVALPHLQLKKGDSKILEVAGDALEARRDNGSVTVLLDKQPLPGYYEMWFSWATQHQEDGVVWNLE